MAVLAGEKNPQSKSQHPALGMMRSMVLNHFQKVTRESKFPVAVQEYTPMAFLKGKVETPKVQRLKGQK